MWGLRSHLSLAYMVWSVLVSAPSVSAIGSKADVKQLRKQVSDFSNALQHVHVHRVKEVASTSVNLSANPSHLASSGDWIEVVWSGVPDPQYDDWIGLWVPAHATLNETSPAKYKYAVASASHISSGSGSLRFKLINYRQDMVFVFLRGGLQKPVAVARSQVIRVLNPNEPLQGHLALTNNPSTMLIQWSTFNSSMPQVKWGSAAGQYNYTALGTSFTYGKSDLCGEPATTVGYVDPGTQHVAYMTGLTPGERYYYTFGDAAWGFSKEYSFLAPPKPGPETTVHILAIADMGQAEVDGSNQLQECMLPSLNTTRLMYEEGPKYSLLLHNGDISYAEGYATQWDNFFHQLEPLATRMPYMVCPGNHERDWPHTGDRFDTPQDSGGECGIPYEKRITMTLPGPDRQWYAFDYGPIHFIQYSTEHDFSPGSPQYQFIVADLQKVDREKTPWLIFGGHRPIYVSTTDDNLPYGDQAVARDLRAALEPLFQEYKVDMTWHGHHHTYQRTCPVYGEKCQHLDEDGTATAPVHLVIGHAGAALSLNEAHPTPKYIEVSKSWWGYLRMQADGTKLRVEIVSDADGSLMDHFELQKPPNWGHRFMQQRNGTGNATSAVNNDAISDGHEKGSVLQEGHHPPKSKSEAQQHHDANKGIKKGRKSKSNDDGS